MNIQIKILNKEFYRVDKMGGSYYDTPNYQTTGSAGLDLRITEECSLFPGGTKVVGTGLAIFIGSASQDVAGMVLPRSSMGKKGLILANTVGLIDADYQGELKMALFNRNQGDDVIFIEKGARIAQLVLVPVLKAWFDIVDEFSLSTSRGDGGFGSTGE